MATAWDNKEFVEAWNNTYGLDMAKAPIRPNVAFPLFAIKSGGVNGKTVADIGCGNGNLYQYFKNDGFSQWYGIDGGIEVLKSAIDNTQDNRVEYMHKDLTKANILQPSLRVAADVAFSTFVIEEISSETLPIFFENVHSILKTGGTAHFFTNHPTNAFYEDMRAIANNGINEKFPDHKGYFDKDASFYTLSVLNQEKGHNIKARWYQNTFSDIINGISRAKLQITEMIEIEKQTKNLDELRNHKAKQGDVPRFLYFSVMK